MYKRRHMLGMLVLLKESLHVMDPRFMTPSSGHIDGKTGLAKAGCSHRLQSNPSSTKDS